MKASDLYLLGKHLMDLARRGMVDDADPRVPEIDQVVTAVLVETDGMTIGELAARTGFAQSHVSTSVARMRDLGWLTARQDPADRRRTLVRPIDAVYEAVAQRQSRGAEQVIARALLETGSAEDDVAGTAQRLTSAAAELYRVLTERALGADTAGSDSSSPKPLFTLAERAGGHSGDVDRKESR
ncbi:MarR family winged helix-turn-helix transcriptional regulator [Amycolatopsis suaedae]|uniref:MarR family transcriptional regulator n=1 Tax=Amycolatopsis suaedae TaxID=2510978 RepID=A0A4Q7JEF5_9PSEU|nr:MarR family transcriptional regulator [Amycolatopsis suaedae]RZQ64794.1 MarR family transcriptional regulator [Amycolatopsis suaedae]